MVFQSELTLHTHDCGEMNDLIDEVTRIVSELGVRTGIVQIFNVGSTGAIGATEFEPGLEQDLPALLRDRCCIGSPGAHTAMGLRMRWIARSELSLQKQRVKSSLGGEGGIRTLGTVTRTPVFETGLFNHSSTSPHGKNPAFSTA